MLWYNLQAPMSIRWTFFNQLWFRWLMLWHVYIYRCTFFYCQKDITKDPLSLLSFVFHVSADLQVRKNMVDCGGGGDGSLVLLSLREKSLFSSSIAFFMTVNFIPTLCIPVLIVSHESLYFCRFWHGQLKQFKNQNGLLMLSEAISKWSSIVIWGNIKMI